jgi:hypothetical protein
MMAEHGTRADRAARVRDVLMLGYAAFWIVWQALLADPVQQALGITLKLSQFITAGGLVVWLVAISTVIWWCVRIQRDKRLRGDELTALNSRRAMVAGYWALTIGVAVATILVAAKAMQPLTVMQALCMLTFVPMLRFVWLERAADA